jgi:hypothetical protein
MAATNLPSDVRGIGAGFASVCVALSFDSRQRNLGPDLPQAAPRARKIRQTGPSGAIAVAHPLIGAHCPSAVALRFDSAVTPLAGLSQPPCDRF